MKITGNYPTIVREKTGLLSLDLALSRMGSMGLPMRTITEIYGYPNVGKSTLAYYLSGKMAGQRKVVICDLELMDREYLSSAIGTSGYDGEVKIVDSTDKKGNPIPHEKMLMEMSTDLYEDEYGSAVMDSVGAVQPISEAKGDFGEAFMGRRAKLVAQMSRALSNSLRNKSEPSCAFVINHVHPKIGSTGHSTAGGETLKYLARVRLMLWTKEVFVREKDETVLGFLVAGQVEKLTYGARGRKFQFYIVPSIGIHTGATALFDALNLGLATSENKVKIGDKAIGYLKADLLSAALEGNQRKFSVFKELTEAYEKEWMTTGFLSQTDTSQPEESGEADTPIEK